MKKLEKNMDENNVGLFLNPITDIQTYSPDKLIYIRLIDASNHKLMVSIQKNGKNISRVTYFDASKSAST